MTDAARGWELEAKAMQEIEERFGALLDVMADLRSRCYREFLAAEIPPEALGGSRGFLLLILTRAMGVYDAVRILLERGYSDEAYGLTRVLYDAEIDAFLLASADEERLQRYADFERWELAVTAARGVDRSVIEMTEEVAEAVDNRRRDLEQGLRDAGIDVPERFCDLPLSQAAETFARRRFDRPFPHTWRPHDGWDEILDEIAPRLVSLVEPGLEEADPDRFREYVEARKVEHRVSWALMSAILHGSPRSLAIRYPEFRIAGNLAEIPKVVNVSTVHFARLHHLVASELAVDYDDAAWAASLRAAKPPDGGGST